MIRIALECALVFLLPAALYFGYHALARDVVDPATGTPKPASQILEEAPLVWLFAAGTALLFGMLFAFATLQEKSIDKPYEPAIYKDGRIQPGGQKK
jgi:hypothetical protein